jgi:DivIVA domain-containing protein
MGQLLLFVVVALVVAAIVFGVTVMLSGGDSGLTPVEPDGRAVPLPSDRPLGEDDISETRFDTAWRGYRMSQVDQALQRAAYDIGYKGELISVLEAEVVALREGRTEDADALRKAREAAIAPVAPPVAAADGPLIEVSAVPPDDPAPSAVAASSASSSAGSSVATGSSSAAGSSAAGSSSAGPPGDAPGADAKESEPAEPR